MLSAYLLTFAHQRNIEQAMVTAGNFWADLFVFSLIAVTLSDVTARRVSNGLSLTVLLSGLLVWCLHLGLVGLSQSLQGASLCFIALIVPYACGAIGAADVKVFAAYGAWVGAAQVAHLALFAAFVAGAMGAVALYEPGPLAVWKIVQAVCDPRDAMAQARRKGQTMPLTLAFSVSAYIIVCGGMP